MNREIRRELANPAAYSHVLHDGGVHSGRNDGAQVLVSLSHFVGEHERVEGDVAFHAATVQEFHQLRQVRLGEIMRPHSRVEFFESEINRVRAVLDRGSGALPVAGGSKEFGQG